MNATLFAIGIWLAHVVIAAWGVYACVVLLKLAKVLYIAATLSADQPTGTPPERRYRKPPRESLIACFALGIGAAVIGVSEAGWALARLSGRISWRPEIIDEVVAGRLTLAIVLFGLYHYHRAERKTWAPPPER